MYERSMGRMAHGTNGLHVVRIVRGTNSLVIKKGDYLGFCFETTWQNVFSKRLVHSLNPRVSKGISRTQIMPGEVGVDPLRLY